MANNYDNAAWFYDNLSRLVFGRALITAQLHLLQFVPTATNILIVGGGTGWILEELTRRHHMGLTVTYVELSAKMIAISGERNTGDNEIHFVNCGIEDSVLPSDFDIVLTPFLFDNFSEATAQKAFNKLNAALKPGGLWLYADFEPTGKWWQKPMLKAMHLFFKLLCDIEASRMPDMKRLFTDTRYQPIDSETFFGEFITTIVYKRPQQPAFKNQAK